ncbi:hypothetical protein CLU79DRAFT_730299 [Phycomyces nitens]|nr:hypothetical protein CLU79DRAFT_730299 [Phycomyces nitens]
MPYTPYTLQPILLSASLEDPFGSQPTIPSTSPPSSFFGRRTTSPPLDGSPAQSSRITLLTGNNLASPVWNSSLSIDAVEAWDTDLYLGTSDGHVLHYTLEAKGRLDQVDVPYASKLKRRINLGFGKKPVERILVLPQVSKAVVLCDSVLSFYTLPFFDSIPVSTIPHIKGVSCFSHDAAEEGRIGEDGTVELCVVKRRVIQVLKIGELAHLKKELPLPDGAIMITRYNSNLCLADSQNYKMINLEQPFTIKLCNTPKIVVSPSGSTYLGSSSPVSRPVATVVKENEFLVVSDIVHDQATIGLIVNGAGEPIRGTIQWSSYPKAICVELPYIAALLRNHTIEIHNFLDQQRLQIIPLDPSFEPRGISLGHGISVWMEDLAVRLRKCAWPKANDEIGSETEQEAELENRLGREIARYSTVPARILVYGRDSVMAQLATPLVIQVDSLLDANRIEEAMEMADQARNSMSVDTSVYGERLQSELDYIFQKAGLLLLKETLFEDAFQHLAKGNIDPRVLVSRFQEFVQLQWLNESPRIVLFEGVQAILNNLGSIEDIVALNIEKNYAKHEEESQKRSSVMNLSCALLNNARDALQKYLEIQRRIRQGRTTSEDLILEVIDTVLLKVYITKDDEQSIHALLKQPNMCNPKLCAEALLKSKRYYALSVLYESKHMYESVLDTWSKIHTGEFPAPSVTNSLGRIQKMLLQDISIDKLPLSVVMEYTWWLTEQSPVDGVEVFIRSPRTADMDPDEILRRLEKYGNEVVRTYLEYIVLERKSDCAEYHTRLACSYVHDVQKEIQADHGHRLEELVSLYQQSTKAKEIQEAKETEDLSKPPILSTFVGFLCHQEQTSLVKSRLLLIKLLQCSPLYSAETLLEALSKDGPLDIERVIVYGRMRMHTEALHILIHDLGDFMGAETYCVTNGHSAGTIVENIKPPPKHPIPVRTSSLAAPIAQKDKKVSPQGRDDKNVRKVIEQKKLSGSELEERKNLFSMLLKTYLTIKDKEIMLARTMHLLNTQGFYLNTFEVLACLPEDLPIQTLQGYLTGSLRRSLHAYRQSNIVLGLSRGENVMVGSELIEIYKDMGPVYVDRQSVCKKCGIYLGNGTIVRSSGGGFPLHIHCAKAMGIVNYGEDEEINEV